MFNLKEAIKRQEEYRSKKFVETYGMGVVNMFKMLDCKTCRGSGVVTEWVVDPTGNECLRELECPNCGQKGE